MKVRLLFFFSLGFMDVGHRGHVYGSWGCRPVSSGGWGWNYCYCCFLSERLLSTVSNEAMQVKSCWMRSPWRGGWGHTSRQGGGCVGVGPRILPNTGKHQGAPRVGISGWLKRCTQLLCHSLVFPTKGNIHAASHLRMLIFYSNKAVYNYCMLLFQWNEFGLERRSLAVDARKAN